MYFGSVDGNDASCHPQRCLLHPPMKNLRGAGRGRWVDINKRAAAAQSRRSRSVFYSPFGDTSSSRSSLEGRCCCCCCCLRRRMKKETCSFFLLVAALVGGASVTGALIPRHGADLQHQADRPVSLSPALSLSQSLSPPLSSSHCRLPLFRMEVILTDIFILRRRCSILLLLL